jgi:hypothetical protein
MGIKVRCTDDTAPYPRPTQITLECDRPSALFCHGFIVFGEMPWTECYSKAMKLGWKESPTGTFICPECSGK